MQKNRRQKGDRIVTALKKLVTGPNVHSKGLNGTGDKCDRIFI